MSDINPVSIKRLWDWTKGEGPTQNAHEDIPLAAAVRVAQHHSDWRPFTVEEFNWFVPLESGYVNVDDLVDHRHARRVDPDPRQPAQQRYVLTPEAIELCYARSITLCLSRP